MWLTKNYFRAGKASTFELCDERPATGLNVKLTQAEIRRWERAKNSWAAIQELLEKKWIEALHEHYSALGEKGAVE